MGPDADDRLEHALEVAYRYLNHRDRTEAEMRRHLEAKGLEGPAIEQSLNTLRDQGYLDDVRFARLLTHDKRELEQWGGERIRRTLLARGVEREVVEHALRGDGSSGDEPIGELERAVALLRRRFPTPPQDGRERERALGVLLRKGYGSELALDALARYRRDPGVESFR